MKSAVDLVALLKSCAKHKDVTRGRRIHEDILEVEKSWLEKNVHIGSALVNMYAKCGEVRKAEEVFEGLPVRSVVSWNALMAGYAQQGYGEKAMTAYEYMQQQGFAPNAVTVTCTLRACGGNLKKGSQIHAVALIASSLPAGNHILGTALLHMYIKNHAISKAEVVFDELPLRDLVCWTTLIAGHCQNDQNEKAVRCFQQMQHEGLSPDAIAFAWILKACGKLGAIDRGSGIHAEVSRKGFLAHHSVVNMALVYMYSGCGAMTMVQGVFAELSGRNVASWTALMSAYSENELDEEAVGCFERMQCEGLCPDGVSFTCALRACGSSLAMKEKGMRTHARIQGASLYRSTNLRIALLDMYSRCGSLVNAREAFHNIQAPDVASWTTMIAGHAQHDRHGNEAIRCFERMQGEGVLPDAVTFACILKACNNSIEDLKRGKEIYVRIRAGCLEKNTILGTAVVDMFAKCGALAKARRVMEEEEVDSNTNVACWNALISGYCRHGHAVEAMECVESMRERSISPDLLTWRGILKACSSLGAIVRGNEIHVEMVRRKEGCTMLATALMNMYAKCGDMLKAQGVFEEIRHRDVVCWTALITGYAHCGRHHEALTCYQRMQCEGLAPDALSFLCVLSAAARSHVATAGQTMSDIICNCYYSEVEASVPSQFEEEHCYWYYYYTCCVVHHLGRAGHIDKALDIIRRRRRASSSSPSGLLWFTLLGACRALGNIDVGQVAFWHTLQIQDAAASC